MFAPPSSKKNQFRKPVLSINKKLLIQSKSKIKAYHLTQKERESINKIASIRTLPPFMIESSQIRANSQRKSIQCSEATSEIWKQQYELFQTNSKQQIIKIDQQLEDVLETIRKQRNMIDIKIWKLKMKLNQIETKHNIQNNAKNQPKNDITTLTQGIEKQQKFQSQLLNQKQTQFPQQMTKYYQMRLKGALFQREGFLQIDQKFDDIEDQVKIRQNKAILCLLLDKIAEN